MSVTIQPEEWERYNRGALDMIAHKVGKIDVLVESHRRLEANQGRMEDSIARLAEAVSKLAVIEERQVQDRKEMADLRALLGEMGKKHDHIIERVMQAVERVETRVDDLEKHEPLNRQARTWIFGGLAMLATIFIYALANILGLKQ